MAHGQISCGLRTMPNVRAVADVLSPAAAFLLLVVFPRSLFTLVRCLFAIGEVSHVRNRPLSSPPLKSKNSLAAQHWSFPLRRPKITLKRCERSDLRSYRSIGHNSRWRGNMRMILSLLLGISIFSVANSALAKTCTERQQVCFRYCDKSYQQKGHEACRAVCGDYLSTCRSTGCWESKVSAKECGFSKN